MMMEQVRMLSLVLPLLLGATPVGGDRRPTEREIEAAHEMLAGDWVIRSIVDDGQTLGPELIRAKFAQSGRIHVGTRTATRIIPGTGERRVTAIRVDPTQHPAEIDITTRFDEVLKGIYKFNGDRLILCLAKSEEDPKPTDFTAADGSNRSLIELELAKPAPPPPPPTDDDAEAIEAARRRDAEIQRRNDEARQRAEEVQRREEEARQRIVGVWEYSDRKGVMTLTFRSDGTFATVRSWSKPLKRMVEGGLTTSQGRWYYSRGVIDARVMASTDPRDLGHVYTGWIESVDSDTLVLRNLFGDLQTAQRLR
jgi:uncharacterized protein (TIGR03067 family)